MDVFEQAPDAAEFADRCHVGIGSHAPTEGALADVCANCDSGDAGCIFEFFHFAGSQADVALTA